jgi:hypothetical protein
MDEGIAMLAASHQQVAAHVMSSYRSESQEAGAAHQTQEHHSSALTVSPLQLTLRIASFSTLP